MQRKVYDAACDEVVRACSVLGPDGRFDSSTLAELEFLEACFYECSFGTNSVSRRAMKLLLRDLHVQIYT